MTTIPSKKIIPKNKLDTDTSAKKKPSPSTPAPSENSLGPAARALLKADNINHQIVQQGENLLDSRKTVATNSARLLGEIVSVRPELVVPLVNRFAQGIGSANSRVVQTSAEALPLIAKRAPARVARQLDVLKSSFDKTTDSGRDGLVRTFAALCAASVAYQKRLEPILAKALEEANAKDLLEWTMIVLPSLKGEPHARARAVVEDRLNFIPRAHAQRIADFLGMKLRVRYR